MVTTGVECYRVSIERADDGTFTVFQEMDDGLKEPICEGIARRSTACAFLLLYLAEVAAGVCRPVDFEAARAIVKESGSAIAFIKQNPREPN